MKPLVFDTGPLSHFARAGEFDTLATITEGRRCVVTPEVREELASGTSENPDLRLPLDADWLETVWTSEPDVLAAFATYAARMVVGSRNIGEASVLAWCRVHDAVALTDDDTARTIGRADGIEVHGSLWLIVNAHRAGMFTEARARDLVDQLRDRGGAWLPVSGAELFDWARREGLLP